MSTKNSGGAAPGDFEFENGVITRYVGGERDIVIPAQINGQTVEKIGERAFLDCESITGVTIPDTVKEIGWFAFQSCRNLVGIVIPESVETIGAWAFQHCDELADVILPDSISDLDIDPFSDCEKIQAVFMGETYDYDRINDLYQAIRWR